MTMHSSQIAYLTLDSVNSRRSTGIPGYRRYALYSTHVYGISVGDFSSEVKFGFVVYKPAWSNPQQIRVELKVLVPTGENTCRLQDIDPETIGKLIETSDLENKPVFVKEGNSGYFVGFGPKMSTSATNLQYVLTCSSAAYFLDRLGDELALMLKGHDGVRNAKDARRVNDLLIELNAFATEMDPGAEFTWGTMSYNIKSAQKKCDEYKANIAKLESNMNTVYEWIHSDLDVLSSYGIDESTIEYS